MGLAQLATVCACRRARIQHAAFVWLNIVTMSFDNQKRPSVSCVDSEFFYGRWASWRKS